MHTKMNTVVKLQGMGEVGELGSEDVGNECRSRMWCRTYEEGVKKK